MRDHGCDDGTCFISTDRRHFLRQSFLSVAGALVAVGATRAEALAIPFEFAAGTRIGRASVAYPIPAADGAQIDKANDVIIVRWQGAVYAFNLACPHQNTALRWEESDTQFQCPKHHSRFSATGEYIEGSGRATRNMDRFAVTRDGNQMLVDVDKLFQDDTDSAAWAAAAIKLT